MGEVTAFLVSKSEIVTVWEKVKCCEHSSGKWVEVNKFTYKSNFIPSPNTQLIIEQLSMEKSLLQIDLMSEYCYLSFS